MKFVIASVMICLWSACQPDYSPEDLRIAYNVLDPSGNDDYDVYVMDLNGEQAIDISNNDGVDWIYHAHGSQLFVISDRDTCARCFRLYETDAKGSHWRMVSQLRLSDSWIDSRNDGKELIVKPHSSIDSCFYIINLQGDILQRIRPPLPYFNDVCFSPDGESIVFRGGLTASKRISGHQDELYILDLETQQMSVLTSYPRDDTTAAWYAYRAGPPRWNPVTNEITYNSTQKNSSRIYALNTAKQRSQPLTSKTTRATWHDVSQDGNLIAFDGQLNYKADSNTYHIYLLNREDRSSKKITSGPGVRQAPVFVYDID